MVLALASMDLYVIYSQVIVCNYKYENSIANHKKERCVTIWPVPVAAQYTFPVQEYSMNLYLECKQRVFMFTFGSEKTLVERP
jgi:hypothetical protein